MVEEKQTAKTPAKKLTPKAPKKMAWGLIALIALALATFSAWDTFKAQQAIQRTLKQIHQATPKPVNLTPLQQALKKQATEIKALQTHRQSSQHTLSLHALVLLERAQLALSAHSNALPWLNAASHILTGTERKVVLKAIASLKVNTNPATLINAINLAKADVNALKQPSTFTPTPAKKVIHNTGWKGALDKTLAKLKSLIVIRHTKIDANTLLSHNNWILVKQQINLDLSLAAWAALQQNPPLFKHAINAALATARTYSPNHAKLNYALSTLKNTPFVYTVPNLQPLIKKLTTPEASAKEETHTAKPIPTAIKPATKSSLKKQTPKPSHTPVMEA